MRKAEVKNKSECETLLAYILMQTITDYISAKKRLDKSKSAKAPGRYWRARRDYESCDEFFTNPPYDYGDIDLTHVRKLCDEKATDGSRVFLDTRSMSSI